MWVSFALSAFALTVPAAPSEAPLHIAAHATAQTTESTPAAVERPKLLVLELERGNVDEATANTIGALLTTAAAREASTYDVISSADMRRLLDMEASREAMQCETGNSCLGELADALGADRVVFGTLGQLGQTTVITLDLFDADRGRAVARESIEVQSMDTLPAALRDGVRRLVGDQKAPATPRQTQDVPPGLMWTTLAGAGLAAAGLGTALVLDARMGAAREEAAYTTFQAVGLTALGIGIAGGLTAATTGTMWALHPTEDTP